MKIIAPDEGAAEIIREDRLLIDLSVKDVPVILGHQTHVYILRSIIRARIYRATNMYNYERAAFEKNATQLRLSLRIIFTLTEVH